MSENGCRMARCIGYDPMQGCVEDIYPCERLIDSLEATLAEKDKQIAALKDEIWHLKGAMKADDLRLVAAAEKAGELDLGCDIPDWLAETILEQREQIATLEKTATEQDDCILHFQTKVAALTVRAESLDRIIAQDTEREVALTIENKRLREFADKTEMAYPEFYLHHWKAALRGGETGKDDNAKT